MLTLVMLKYIYIETECYIEVHCYI